MISLPAETKKKEIVTEGDVTLIESVKGRQRDESRRLNVEEKV